MDGEEDPSDKDSENWKDASTGAIFNSVLWEPGYTEVKHIKIENEGNLALEYLLDIIPYDDNGNRLTLDALEVDGVNLAKAIDVYYLDPAEVINDRADLSVKTPMGTLYDALKNLSSTAKGELKEDETHTITLALKMQEGAGNEYQGKSIGSNFAIRLIATQFNSEQDSFDKDYDINSEWPVNDYHGSESASSAVTPTAENKIPTGGVTLSNSKGTISASLPEGVLLDNNTSTVTLTVSEVDQSQANISLSENEASVSVDVHIDGVSKNNDTVIKVDIDKLLPVGLNMGNYRFYHVENGNTVEMTLLADGAVPVHNNYEYEPATGNVSLYLKSFSEFALVADTENAWNGTVAEAFAGGTGTKEDPYIIANADQLAYMGDRVSNDNAAYGNAHYQLIADVNIGGSDNYDENGVVFYPIGYNKVGGEVAALAINDDLDEIYFEPINPALPGDKDGDVVMAIGGNSWYTYGGSFKGIFDGMGHTVSGIYQNTWIMKGNYDGHYYNDAMGLFGYVNGGTVKNLTIDNFYSDGEFAPTGCVTAYADGSATFENINITKSHPQTYNTGVAGIVGWDNGNSSVFTFKNITVDATNTMSALWGSWDVAAAGILGSLKDGSIANFENCNVAATIDVYNDVCGNYQYYWYRYSGAYIGTVYKRRDNGNGALDLSNVTAKNCTVNFGDRHEYYYCEFIENTKASYTHDYQMSRVDNKDIDLSGDAATCLNHNHEEHGYETVNGASVLIEDKQAVYIPYRQLFGGYGWGVDGVDLGEYENIDITYLTESVEKFEIILDVDFLANNKEYAIEDLFAAKPDKIINTSGVYVTIDKLDENATVEGTFTANTSDWTKGTISFSGSGCVNITIQDYHFCKPTVLCIKVVDPTDSAYAEDKFETKFTGDILYRVGNANTVTVGSLFGAKDGATINNPGVYVTIDKVDEDSNVSGLFTANTTDWTKGTVKFDGTGVVKVTIQDYDFCTPTVLYLEVIEAVNATSATSATKNNVVLLNDAGFSSIEVNGGYTLFGNGFTLTCGSDSAALDMGYSFVTLENGTLDNVQIVCPNFDYAVLYKSNMTESDNRSETTDKTRYYNVKSGVMASGNSYILNSRISGGRAAVNVTGGNVVIDNSRIELGAVASIFVGTANLLTLRDVTLVQKPTVSTHDSSKTLMGFSVLAVCDANGDAAHINIEGNLVQHAWIDENDKEYVPSAGKSIISTVLSQTDYLHDLDGDGENESLNLGFAYMPESLTSKVNATTITDNRTNKNSIPYDYAEVSILNGKTYVYSYKNTNGTDASFKEETEYKPDKYSDIITVNYSDAADGLSFGKSLGDNGWIYELNVDLDKLNGYALDFAKMSMSINGVSVTDFKVNGSAKPASPVAVTAGGTMYALTAIVDGKEYAVEYKVTGTETSKESPSLVASNYEEGLCVASSYGGTWHGAAPALKGIQIKYWSVAEKQYKTINLENYTPTTPGKQNETSTTWTYSPDNGDFTLTLTGGQVHSSNKVYAMPVVCDSTLYFVAASSNGLVNTGNSARTIPVSYSFKDNNNGDVLTFSHTWSVAENKDEQYNYSDFCNGKKTKLEKECITPDTLITLADGSQKRVDSLTGEELLLVWNLETGKYDAAPIVFVDSEEESEYEIIHLYFSDGSDVKVIYEHGFFDLDLGKYIYIDASNYSDYIGHRFVTESNVASNQWNTVTLDNVVIERVVTTAWSPVTYEHLCYYTNGVLSMPGGISGLFNIFEVDTDDMCYDAEQMQKDIEVYGLFSFEDFNGLIPEIAFEAFNGDMLKVAIGKGLLTWEDIVKLAERYVPLI